MQRTAAIVKPLSNFIYRTMQVGVLLIAAGTILGGVWADYSWGRFWGWDPKEVWALITLLVYLIPLHGRFAGWVSTFGLVVASVVCFLSVVMAWYGVNFVLGVGLHSYGFVEGGSQGIMSVIIAGVLVCRPPPAGDGSWDNGRWRRSRASQVSLKRDWGRRRSETRRPARPAYRQRPRRLGDRSRSFGSDRPTRPCLTRMRWLAPCSPAEANKSAARPHGLARHARGPRAP